MKTERTLKTNIKHDPFLRWPGGKRWFISHFSEFFPENYNRYFEPFLGSGAVFFSLSPKEAILSDINFDLINTFQILKTDWKFIRRSLIQHNALHSSEHYYKVRKSISSNSKKKAAKFIYLNRTCFNGIYRVNREGQFNVPIGTKNKVILNTDNFELQSEILQNASIIHSDFESVINQAQENDFVFADPPYTVRHNLNGFIQYNEKLFSWSDQERLADTLYRAKKRGVKILLTNANHESIRELYQNKGFNLKVASRFSSISASASNRKQFEELIITSY